MATNVGGGLASPKLIKRRTVNYTQRLKTKLPHRAHCREHAVPPFISPYSMDWARTCMTTTEQRRPKRARGVNPPTVLGSCLAPCRQLFLTGQRCRGKTKDHLVVRKARREEEYLLERKPRYTTYVALARRCMGLAVLIVVGSDEIRSCGRSRARCF